jgi:hypothetical protein|nr:MAG TPA: hypothetical protein [Caudoviricetes sp.]
MYYALIVVVIIGVVVYACLKKKRGNTEKPHEEEKPHDVDNHTGITVKVPIESKGCIVKDGIKKEVTIKYMPQGLQVFDENGVCVMDITARLTRIIDSIEITADEFSKKYNIQAGNELWWIYVAPTDSSPPDGDFTVGIKGINVDIEYISQTEVKIDVSRGISGGYLLIGVV